MAKFAVTVTLTIIFSLFFVLAHARIPSNLIAENKLSESEETVTTAKSIQLPTLGSESETQSTVSITDLQTSNTDENTIRAIGIIHFHPINRHFRHHMHMKHNCHHHGKHMLGPREVSYGNDMILSDGKGSESFDRSQFFAKPFGKVDEEALTQKYVSRMSYGKGMKIKKHKKKGGFLKKVSKFLDDLF